jgi:hypothetical protein
MTLLLAYAVVFLVSAVPAFMPPAWAVLSFCYVEFGLPLLPLTVGGALAAALGRTLLAAGSARFRGWVARGREADVAALHDYLAERGRGVFWGTFLYSVSPLPTNDLFIAGGIVGARRSWMIAGCWAGCAVNYTFWVWVAGHAVDSLAGLFEPSQHGWLALIAQLLGVLFAVLLIRLPWHRWLIRRVSGGPETRRTGE